MDQFSIQGENGFITISFVSVYGFPESTSFFGGYDVEANIQMEADEFKANGKFSLTTADVYKFYQELKPAYQKVEGKATFINYEENLNFDVVFKRDGKVRINGLYKSHSKYETALNFGISSDQTYVNKTLATLKRIVKKYGDSKGVYF